MGSLGKKLWTMLKTGLDPVVEGRQNYGNGSMESTAKQRAQACVGCENYVDEPIDFLAVKDDRIPELSGKMCNDCGCALPYLLRQNSKLCKKWTKND